MKIRDIHYKLLLHDIEIEMINNYYTHTYSIDFEQISQNEKKWRKKLLSSCVFFFFPIRDRANKLFILLY